MVRCAAGKKWVDQTLTEWPANDFRLFVGDIAKEVTEADLARAFAGYKSVAKVKVIKDSRTNMSKGYGFVSLLDAGDAARCIREMNDKYVGGRPIKVKKSDWKERDVRVVKKKRKMEEKRKREWK